MKAEKVIAQLEKSIVTLKKLEGEDVSGYALVISPSPDTPIIEYLALASSEDEQTFFQFLANKFKNVKEQNQFGGTTKRVY